MIDYIVDTHNIDIDPECLKNAKVAPSLSFIILHLLEQPNVPCSLDDVQLFYLTIDTIL